MSPAVSSQRISWQRVSDGAGTYPTGLVFPGVDAETLAEAGIGDQVTTPYYAVLVTVDGSRVLVDAGLGEMAAAMGGTAGRLVAELGAIGVEPDDIDDVIVSHAHPDHVGGLLTAGRPTFARARHHLSRAERDFWLAPNPQERLFPAMADTMVTAARGTIQALDDAGLLALCEPGAEPVSGIRLVDTPGHTPGHVAVEVDTGDDTLLYAADAFIDELQLEHPDWTALFDTDDADTVASRRALLDRAVERGAIVAAYHLERTGRIVRAGDVYRFEPES
jgi:glyoxylase-like metal-dependent hydrolase (beta-lactamase superfamily II)